MHIPSGHQPLLLDPIPPSSITDTHLCIQSWFRPSRSSSKDDPRLTLHSRRPLSTEAEGFLRVAF
jgi:hypothetical protein